MVDSVDDRGIDASLGGRGDHDLLRATGQVLWEDPAMVGENTFYTRAAGLSSNRLRGNAEVFLPTVRSFPTDEENRAASESLEQLATVIFHRVVEPW